MGLDGVELVMKLEEAFRVELKGDEAIQTVTPRMVGDLIFSKLQSTDQRVCQSQRAFYLLRKAFVRHFGLWRAAVTPDVAATSAKIKATTLSPGQYLIFHQSTMSRPKKDRN